MIKEVDLKKIELCPNCVIPSDISISKNETVEIRNQYGLPKDKKVLLFNLLGIKSSEEINNIKIDTD